MEIAVQTRSRLTLVDSLRRHITPRLSVAIVLWRIEAALATPVALLLVASMGRWSGALVMGLVMAFFSALFLFMLRGESAVDAFRDWTQAHPVVRRFYLPLVKDRGRLTVILMIASLPVIVLLVGPFWRAILLHSFSIRKEFAYVISVLGSIPHALLWTGLVLGGLWEGLIWPLLDGKLF